MQRMMREIQANLGQCYSPTKLQQIFLFPITGWSCVKGFVLPFVLPVLAVSLSLVPLDDPENGFQGRNLNLILLGFCAAAIVLFSADVRFSKIIPETQLTVKKRTWCAVVAILVMLLCCTICWYFIAFPFPFGTYFSHCNVKQDVLSVGSDALWGCLGGPRVHRDVEVFRSAHLGSEVELGHCSYHGRLCDFAGP